MKRAAWLGLAVTTGVAMPACTADNPTPGGPTACGDGVRQRGEVCDGNDFGGTDCLSLGRPPGTLACAADCAGIDASGCNAAACGDRRISGDEVCDGTLLGGRTCADLGFAAGALACAADCRAYDTSGCVLAPAGCGNGLAEGYEVCDRGDWMVGWGPACADLGLGAGAVVCTALCRGDVSGCEQPDLCTARGLRGDGQSCDVCDLGGGAPDPDCTALCGDDRVCADRFDRITGLWTCQHAGIPDLDCFCGDGIAQGNEPCDGQEPPGLSCDAYGYTSGEPTCRPDCTLDFSGCGHDRCGDGVRGASEVCDGVLLGGADCRALGYDGGVLACAEGCGGFDVSRCTSPAVCGDGDVGGPESCDTNDPTPPSCHDLGFQGGAVTCSSDCLSLDVSLCHGLSTCGDGVASGLERCDGGDFDERGSACAGFGLGPGTLGCTAGCAIDTAPCAFHDVCRVFGWYGDQSCDACELLGGTPDPGCATACGADGYCADRFDALTLTWTCRAGGFVDPDCGPCGNGIVEDRELCDRAAFPAGRATCMDYGYASGTLTCRLDCVPDFSACSPARSSP